jgi:hypothetical protein
VVTGGRKLRLAVVLRHGKKIANAGSGNFALSISSPDSEAVGTTLKSF